MWIKLPVETGKMCIRDSGMPGFAEGASAVRAFGSDALEDVYKRQGKRMPGAGAGKPVGGLPD